MAESNIKDRPVGMFADLSRRYGKMLDPDEELRLANLVYEKQDPDAMRQLTLAFIPLVNKLAFKFKKYGADDNDLKSEGRLGLAKAINKFEPNKGFRLGAYAKYWIKAQMQEYVMRNHSLMNIGTTKEKKSLFFNLPHLSIEVKRKFPNLNDFERHQKISEMTGISMETVIEVELRMEGEISLNSPISHNDGSSSTWLDRIEADTTSIDEVIGEQQDMAQKFNLLADVLSKDLSDREQKILVARRLDEEPPTLEVLGQVYGVSKERIRQIEVRAFEKVQRAMRPSQ